MRNPNWDMAPVWANYVAQNEDGRWHWYESKPTPMHQARAWGTIGKRESVWPTVVDYWRETLTLRPSLEEE